MIYAKKLLINIKSSKIVKLKINLKLLDSWKRK